MEVNIVYNGETIKFNLNDELKISETKMANELKEQPSIYAYISILHKKLIIQHESLEAKLDKTFGKLFNNYKTSKTSKHYEQTHRPPSDDVCKNYVLSNGDYIDLQKKVIKAKEDMLTLGSIVRGFEQRADLMQTLAANARKERL